MAMALIAAFRARRIAYRIGLESPALSGPPLSHSWRRNCLSFPHALLLVYLAAPLCVPPLKAEGVLTLANLSHRFLSPAGVPDETSPLTQFPVEVNLSVRPATPRNALISFLTLHFASYI